MPKFEYQFEEIFSGEDPVEKLNEWGAEDWQVVWMKDHPDPIEGDSFQLFLMRQIEQTEEEETEETITFIGDLYAFIDRWKGRDRK